MSAAADQSAHIVYTVQCVAYSYSYIVFGNWRRPRDSVPAYSVPGSRHLQQQQQQQHVLIYTSCARSKTRGSFFEEPPHHHHKRDSKATCSDCPPLSQLVAPILQNTQLRWAIPIRQPMCRSYFSSIIFNNWLPWLTPTAAYCWLLFVLIRRRLHSHTTVPSCLHRLIHFLRISSGLW